MDYYCTRSLLPACKSCVPVRPHSQQGSCVQCVRQLCSPQAWHVGVQLGQSMQRHQMGQVPASPQLQCRPQQP